MEYDIHTLLDMATLVTTLWVIYMIRFKLKSSYMDDKDNLAMYYVVSYLMPNNLLYKKLQLVKNVVFLQTFGVGLC